MVVPGFSTAAREGKLPSAIKSGMTPHAKHMTWLMQTRGGETDPTYRWEDLLCHNARV